MRQLRLSATESENALDIVLWDCSGEPPASERELVRGTVSIACSALWREIRAALGSPVAALGIEDLLGLSRRFSASALPREVYNALAAVCASATVDIGVSIETTKAAGVSAQAWRALPWELLYLHTDEQATESPDFIAGRRANVHLLRLVPGLPTPAAMPGNFHILVVHADPGTTSFPPLAIAEKEARSVARAAERFAEVRLVTNATPAVLKRAMEEFAPTAVHFVGHGYDSVDGGGLVLHGAREGVEERLPATEFARWIKETGVWLCVASCCWSAARPSSIAYELVQNGAAAVIGSQFSWHDSAGGLFANALYGALAHGCSLAEALIDGRQALLGMGADWVAPVLVAASETVTAIRWAKSSAPFVVPFPRNPDFVGREDDLIQIRRALLSEPSRPVVIVGIGGIGKTSMAVEAAHRFREDFPAGVFWIDARDESTEQAAFSKVGDRLGVPPNQSLEDRSLEARARLSELQRPSLIILDNLSDTRFIGAINGQCRSLITTRERKNAPAAAFLIGPRGMEVSEGVEILRRPSPTRRGRPERIVDLVGGLPLALSLAARYMERTGLSFDAYADRLATHRERTLEAARGGFISTTGHDGRIFDAIDITWQAMEEFPRYVLTGACCFSNRSIPRHLVLDVCSPDDPVSFDDAIGILYDSSLISHEGDGRFSIHELVRVFVHGHERNEARLQAARACADLFIAKLRTANDRMDWLTIRPESSHCREITRICKEWGLCELACGLSLEYGAAEHGVGELGLADLYLRDALRAAVELYGNNHSFTAEALWHLAEVRQDLGHWRDAIEYAEDAVSVGRQCSDVGSQLMADLENGLGYVLRMQGRIEDALTPYQEALRLRLTHFGEPSLPVSVSLNNLGTLAEARGDFNEAMTYLQRSVDGLRSLFGERHQLLAAALNSMGRVLRIEERYEEAIASHRSALEMFEYLYGRKHVHIAMTLVFLSGAIRHTEAPEAEALAAEGLGILEELYGKDHRVYVAATRRLEADRQN